MYEEIERDFWHIEYPEDSVSNLWVGRLSRDFELMSLDYHHAGQCILSKVLDNRESNYVCDFVFPVALYMLRHAIELALKSVVCARSGNVQISECFQHDKHDIGSLFRRCKPAMGDVLDSVDIEWLEGFAFSASLWDPKADLLKYPPSRKSNRLFDDSHIDDNGFVDIEETSRTLITAYRLISRCFEDGESNSPICQANTSYFSIGGIGIGDCSFRRSKTSDKYYLVAEGFADAAKIVYSESCLTWREKCFPLLFLLRHAIELELKHLTCGRNVIGAKGDPGHKLEQLWKAPKDILGDRARGSGWDLSLLDSVSQRLEELSKLDKGGFLFRYPVNKSMEYKIPGGKTLDVRSIYECQMAVIEFLDGCNSVIDEMADYELEMSQGYE